MSAINVEFAITISLIFGILFILQEVYHDKIQIHYSFVAGVSITYFFLVMLPEVIRGLPQFPSHLEDFKYFFPLFGFVVILILDKIILQRVEKANQQKISQYSSQTNKLEIVEDRISGFMDDEIQSPHFDRDALREISKAHQSLMKQKEELKKECKELERKIIYHVRKDIDELRDFVDFSYHVLVGIILILFMDHNIVSGILFFSVSFLMAIITGSPVNYQHQLFSDLEINPDAYREIEYKHKSLKHRILLGSSVLIGVFIGLIVQYVGGIDFDTVYMIFAFIAGVLLYIIVHETIPEKEKGRPLYFGIGFFGFMLFVYGLQWFELTY